MHHTINRKQRLVFVIRFTRRILQAYRSCHLSRSAAALSYYLLLALFPMIVCISILLYRRITLTATVGGEALAWLDMILQAIGGISLENPSGLPSTAIFAAALTLLLSASAGAFRCLGVSAAEITAHMMPEIFDRHDSRCGFSGMLGLVVGYLFATVLFLSVYAAIFLLLLWEELTALITHYIPANALTDLISATRYLVLFLLFFALCWGLMRILPPNLPLSLSKGGHGREKRRISVAPGALISTAGLIFVTVWFSLFIRGSVRYSLVYGSLASMILFLTWIFVCGNVLLLGIAVNASLEQMAKY